MIPVLGFLTVKRFDLAERMLASIDYPVGDLVCVNNSGDPSWRMPKVEFAQRQWQIDLPHGLGYGAGLNLIVKTTPFAPYWLLVNDDSQFYPGALSKIAAQADSTTINFLSIMPKWSAFVLGENVVEQVGLFDERFHPIYFEDNDYERRIKAAGFEAKFIHASLLHDNSSSLHSQNDVTFHRNHELYKSKVESGDLTEGNWSLTIRRDNRWD